MGRTIQISDKLSERADVVPHALDSRAEKDREYKRETAKPAKKEAR